MSRLFGLITLAAVAAFGLPSALFAADAPPVAASSAAAPSLTSSVAAPSPTSSAAAPSPTLPAMAPPEGAASTGFRVVSQEIAAERDAPQACFTFSERLDKARGRDYANFVEVMPLAHPLSVIARDRTLCVEGLTHGEAYTITLRDGLPGADGLALAHRENRDVVVPNRAPSLAFRGAGTILPRVGAEGLPLRSINVEHARLRVLRIADRSLVEQIYAGRVSQTLSDWDIGDRVEKAGQPVWAGELAISAPRNAPTLTPFPIEPVLDGLERGVYVAMAEMALPTKPTAGRDARTSQGAASQWFVVSDLGLTSFIGDDGLMVFARSLTSAEPVAGVALHLLARNGKELASRVTGADGIARFEASIAHKGGDDGAQALFAYGAGGDFSFLDLAAPGFDLSDRGAEGRVTPGPLDAFLASDRGIYRPGETVNITALVRSGDVVAVPGHPLVLKLWRPDGFEADRHEVGDGGNGGAATGFTLPVVALPGAWSVTAHVDGSDAVVGRVEFTVDDFTPPRLDFTLTADRPGLTDGNGVTLTIDGHTLYGAPAANLPGELSLTLRAAEAPFPGHIGFRFGLAQEKLVPVPTELPGFTTDAGGKAAVVLAAPKLPDSSHPLEAVVRSTVFDIGGRAVSRELVLPVQHQPFAIGVRPRFEDGAVPEGATAGFEVIAVAADGAPIDQASLSYELYEEESDYRWFEANGRWDYETILHDHRVTGGTLTVAAATPATIEEPVGAGRYRLEVFDTKTGVATSVRFAAGWWVTPASGSRPDKVEVSIMQPRTGSGAVARVYIRPPYDSQVLIAVADRSIRRTLTQPISAQGAFLDIPVDPSWTAGVTIIATAYGAQDALRKTPPRRAIGVGWLAVDPSPHTLAVKLEAPVTLEPRQTLTVGVAVRDDAGKPLAAGSSAYLTLAAVDDAVLQLSGHVVPDPVAYYLGPRQLGVELRDVYGRLLESARAEKAVVPSGVPDKERRKLRQVPSLPERDSPVVSLFSGVVAVDADGNAQVPLTVPDFDGRIRLMAIAWSDARVGHADLTVTVRDRVAADLALPRFLAPGDHARIDLTLSNLGGAAGDYQVTLSSDGGVSIADGTLTIPALKRGRHTTVSRPLTADATGPATVRLEITGPEGYHLIRSRTLTIRAEETPILRHSFATVAPSTPTDQPLPLSGGAMLDGLKPDTVTMALSISPWPVFDVPGLVVGSDRPIWNNAEKLASGVLRLLAGRDTVVALGTETADTLHQKIQAALVRLLALQKADGGFALWSPKTEADPWLTSFAADVLGRARDAGYGVPEAATRLSQDWLKRMLDNGWFEDRELPSRAYATWLLARAKALDVGAVQFFQETYGAKLPSDLARAQIAAALAALGDGRGAADAFERLASDKGTGRIGGPDLADYGSDLRDRAGVVALAAESGAVSAERLTALAERLAARLAASDLRLPSQDKAWLALAARALVDRLPASPPAAAAKIAIGDTVTDVTRPSYQRLDLAALPILRNVGTVPLYQALSVAGLALDPPVAAEHGLTITRTMFDMAGKPVKPDTIRQNQVLVVILEGRSVEMLRQQVLVTDLLPAGFEIETVRLANSPQLGGLSWLGELSAARHIVYRNDRFVAAIDLDEAHPGFRIVYLARAVTPGDFAQPGALVESVRDPEQWARAAVGRLHILAEKE